MPGMCASLSGMYPSARTNLEGLLRDVHAEHRHAPFVRRHEAEERFEHRALAGAVGAEQTDRSSRERRRDVLERAIRAVDDRHPVKADHGRRGRLRRGGHLHHSVRLTVYGNPEIEFGTDTVTACRAAPARRPARA